MLSWKNYGNGHVIFDASNSTSPTGSAVNNTNSAIAWTGTYPTLMGWNGNQTYGVRVDSARVADSATNADTVDNTHVANGITNYLSKYSDASHIIASTLVYDTGTNVGIGTTGPSAKLAIAAAASGGLYVGNGTFNNPEGWNQVIDLQGV